MAVSGVRISWLMLARKAVLRRTIVSASARLASAASRALTRSASNCLRSLTSSPLW